VTWTLTLGYSNQIMTNKKIIANRNIEKKRKFSNPWGENYLKFGNTGEKGEFSGPIEMVENELLLFYQYAEKRIKKQEIEEEKQIEAKKQIEAEKQEIEAKKQKTHPGTEDKRLV